MHVLGSTDGLGPVGHLGAYRARDGSPGEEVGIDLGGPHAALVVGKRGSGKSYTLGVLAEEAARTDGIAPILLDPMGAFDTLADTPEEVPARVAEPRVSADALDPQTWCSLPSLDPTGAVGALVWRVAGETETLAGIVEAVGEHDAPDAVRVAAEIHSHSRRHGTSSTARHRPSSDPKRPYSTARGSPTPRRTRSVSPSPAGATEGDSTGRSTDSRSCSSTRPTSPSRVSRRAPSGGYSHAGVLPA